jgi:protoporphyrinogen oxidase
MESSVKVACWSSSSFFSIFFQYLKNKIQTKWQGCISNVRGNETIRTNQTNVDHCTTNNEQRTTTNNEQQLVWDTNNSVANANASALLKADEQRREDKKKQKQFEATNGDFLDACK